MIAYQIGALQAMAAYAGAKVTHLKPHGALNNMAAENAELRDGDRPRDQGGRPRHHLCRARRLGDGEGGPRSSGLPIAREGFCDRHYDDDGNSTSRKIPGAVLKDPKAVARAGRAHGAATARSCRATASASSARCDTLCVHGDEPTAIVGRARRAPGLEAAGVKVVPLPRWRIG